MRSTFEARTRSSGELQRQDGINSGAVRFPHKDKPGVEAGTGHLEVKEPRIATKRSALGFTPLPRSHKKKGAPNLAATQATQSPQHEQNYHSSGPTPCCHSPSSFRTPAVAKLPAPGHAFEAAPLAAPQPTSDIPTHVPAGDAMRRCLAVCSPQPAQPRPWGVLSLQQQAVQDAAPAAEREQREKQPPAEDSQVDSDFCEPNRPRGFQGGRSRKRQSRNAGYAGSKIGAQNHRSIDKCSNAKRHATAVQTYQKSPENKDPQLEHSTAAERGTACNQGSSKDSPPEWRRKQSPGKQLQEADGANPVQPPLRVHALPEQTVRVPLIDQAKDGGEQQDIEPPPEQQQQPSEQAASDRERCHTLDDGSGPAMAPMSYVPETCPAGSLPAFDSVPDTPDTLLCRGSERPTTVHNSSHAAGSRALQLTTVGKEHRRLECTGPANDGNAAVSSQRNACRAGAASNLAEGVEGGNGRALLGEDSASCRNTTTLEQDASSCSQASGGEGCGGGAKPHHNGIEAAAIDFGRPVLAIVPSSDGRSASLLPTSARCCAGATILIDAILIVYPWCLAHRFLGVGLGSSERETSCTIEVWSFNGLSEELSANFMGCVDARLSTDQLADMQLQHALTVSAERCCTISHQLYTSARCQNVLLCLLN